MLGHPRGSRYSRGAKVSRLSTCSDAVKDLPDHELARMKRMEIKGRSCCSAQIMVQLLGSLLSFLKVRD